MNEQLDTTEPVTTTPSLSLSGHQLIQEGYMIHDTCSPSRPDCYSGAFSIGYGKMLIKNDKGEYEVVDETRSQ